MLRTFYATSFLSCVGILRHDSRDGAHENVNSYNVTTLEENLGFTYQNRCAAEWMIGVIAIYVHPKNFFFCIASNTEFFLSQYMGSFPVAIPDIASRAEFVRSQLEILRICGNEIKGYEQSPTVVLVKTKKRYTTRSFRILETLRDKVMIHDFTLKNKERKSRLTGSSSNYDSPRNHQGERERERENSVKRIGKEFEDYHQEGRISHPAVRKGMTYVRSVCKSGEKPEARPVTNFLYGKPRGFRA
ncbi:hypothetical protein ALC60_13665 [Trachymyrmex zeteki]|uniref:Uncharacterized protein n=1 Tax=Mycetomoellerius zeteki TaxID=64791 RepID=A0A151WHL6_9HYME|nr:hypothetical protein ALC60_13665 [Trachymyrmex zeteki]